MAWNLFKVLVPFGLLMGGATLAFQKITEALLPLTGTTACYAIILVGFVGLMWAYLCMVAPTINRISSANASLVGPSEYPDIEYLITGYSPLALSTKVKNNIPAEEHAVREETEAKYRIDEFVSANDPNSLDDAIAADSFLSWQQNLRAIHEVRRAGKLKIVYIIQPSKDQNQLFIGFLKRYFENLEFRMVSAKNNRDEVFSVREGKKDIRDYESFNYVSKAFNRAFELISIEEGKPQEEIESAVAVDVTPGTKIYSIAAAIQSLNRRILFFYARSGEGTNGEVLAFDAMVSIAGSPG